MHACVRRCGNLTCCVSQPRVDEGQKSLRHRSLALTDCSSTSDGDTLSPLSFSMSNSLSPASVGVTSELHMSCTHDPIPITHETRRNHNPFSDGPSSVADTSLLSPPSSFVSNSPSASYHSDGQPSYRSIPPYSPEDVNNAYSGASDSSCSPGLLSASANQALQFAANSPGLMSSTNSPGQLSSAASVGLSPSNSPRYQPVANSPPLLSAANSPGQFTATSSPGRLSPASNSSSSSTNGAIEHPANYYHDNSGVYYCDFPHGTPGAVSTADQSNYRPLNTGPGLLSYANGPGIQVPLGAMPTPHSLTTHVQQIPVYNPPVHFSTSNFIAMATAPSSMRMGVPSSTPSVVNGTSELHCDMDFSRLLSELEGIPFKA